MVTDHFGRRKSAKSQFSVSVGGKKEGEKQSRMCYSIMETIWGSFGRQVFWDRVRYFSHEGAIFVFEYANGNTVSLHISSAGRTGSIPTNFRYSYTICRDSNGKVCSQKI
jgi:hypothetical protein